MLRTERGSMLLEAVVALAIVGSAGVGMVSVVAAALRQEVELEHRERDLGEAERALAAMALLTRPELDRRLGRRTIAGFVVFTSRPEPSLYRIAVADEGAPDFERLVTVVYRPDGVPR